MKSNNSIKRILGLIIVGAAGSLPMAMSQPLDSLVRRVNELHPSVASARLAAERAEARSRGAAAWDPPSVGLQFSMLPPGNPNPLTRGESMLMFEQAFPLFGQKDAMIRAMALGTEVGEAELDAVRRELRTRVAGEYYRLWLVEQRRRLNFRSRQIADLLHRTVEAHYMVDHTAQSDINRSAIEIERLAAELRTIEEDRLDALARLNLLLGRPLSTPVTVDSLLGFARLAPLDSLAPGLADHPRLRAMEAMSRMSDAESEAELSMLKPMLMLSAGISWMPEGHPVREGSEVLATLGGEGHGTTGTTEMHVDRFAISAGAMLSIPIAPWSRVGPEERALDRRLAAEQGRLDREAMAREMEGMLRTAYGSARRAAVQIGFIRGSQIPLLEQSLELSRLNYMNGRGAFATVFDNYSMLVMAAMDGAMQEMEYAMAMSMIDELTGGAR